MKKLCLFLFQLVAIIILSGCISTSNFQSWNGPTDFDGQGGAFIEKDGIDVYSSGTPKKKCQILGIIHTSVISSANMMAVFGNSWSTSALIKEAKSRGGNAVIITDTRTDILGWSSSGTATAYQTGNTTTAYGNSQTTENVSGNQMAVLVKYVGEIRDQNVSPESESKLLGHWLFIPPTAMPLRGQLEIYFLPQNRYKSVSSLLNTNGQPVEATPEDNGRYYFDGNKLVTWGDKDAKPEPPAAFTVTDSQLTFYLPTNNVQHELVFQKQTQ
jgi:hypothetical protein